MNERAVLSHLALLTLTLLALALRVWGLGASSGTHDEVYGLWVATRPLTDVLPATVRDVHPPLYYLLMYVWLSLGPHSDTWARLPSALVGTALVPAVYALGRRLPARTRRADGWDARVGLVAALLTALSPLAVAQAREARMYPLIVLLLALAAYALLRATEEHRLRWWAAYVLLFTLALYTHYYAIFVLIPFTFYTLRTTHHTPRTMLHALLPPVSCLLLYLPWLPALADQFSRVRAGFWIPPPSPEALGKVAQTLSFFAVTPRPSTATPEDFAVKVVGAAGVAVALFMAGVAPGRRRLLLALWLVLPVVLAYAVSVVGPSIFEPRYFAVCLPAFLLLVARGATWMPQFHRSARRVRGKYMKISASFAFSAVRPVLLIGLVIASLASLHIFATFPAYRPPDARAAAAWLRSCAGSGDVVVHTSQFSLRPIVWYNGDGAAGVLIDDPALPARLVHASRVFLVVAYDVRQADGPRQPDAAAAQWAREHNLWDLQTVARFWGVHIYEWTN